MVRRILLRDGLSEEPRREAVAGGSPLVPPTGLGKTAILAAVYWHPAVEKTGAKGNTAETSVA